MKKRTWLYVVFSLAFYLLFLIVQMPTAWLVWGLNRFTSGAVHLDPIMGNAWGGSGHLVIYYPQTVPHDLGIAEWRVNPIWLFTGHVQTYLRSESTDVRFRTTLRFGRGQTQLIETEARLPAQTLGAFYPPAVLISPKGEVLARTDKLVIGNNSIEGNAEILWQNAGSDLSSVQPLGDYRLEITGTGQSAVLKLSTLKGVLDLTGQGQWQVQTKQIQLTGSASPRQRAAELDPLLKLFGEDQGNGKRSFSITNRLAAP